MSQPGKKVPSNAVDPKSESKGKPIRKRESGHVEYHKDGSIWAKGPMKSGKPHGYWEWFRKCGTRMRSGSFDQGRQTGEWTTYDQKGAVYKVTQIKMKPAGTS